MHMLEVISELYDKIFQNDSYSDCCCFFIGMNSENTESQRMTKIMAEIQALQEVVTRFRQMRLDATEFACLKCIVTFKAG